jgi:surface protein
MAIIDELNNLQTSIVTLKKVLADNINAKGVSVSENDTLTSLSNAVKNIPQEGGGNPFEDIGYTVTPQFVQDDINYSKLLYEDWNESDNIYFVGNNYPELVYCPMINTSNMNSMYGMFQNCNKLVYVPKLDTSNVTTFYNTFAYCTKLKYIDSKDWDTSNVNNMYYMFKDCSSLTELYLNNWDTSKVTTIYGLFNGCTNLKYLDITGWDFSAVTNKNNWLLNCSNLTTIIAVNTKSLPTLSGSNITEIDISESTSTSTYNLFSGCTNLTTVTAENYDIYSVTSYNNMFKNCRKLTSLILGNVTQEQYEWWYARLSDASIQNNVTITYNLI